MNSGDELFSAVLGCYHPVQLPAEIADELQNYINESQIEWNLRNI